MNVGAGELKGLEEEFDELSGEIAGLRIRKGEKERGHLSYAFEKAEGDTAVVLTFGGHYPKVEELVVRMNGFVRRPNPFALDKPAAGAEEVRAGVSADGYSFAGKGCGLEWLENALAAVPEGSRVVVAARREGGRGRVAEVLSLLAKLGLESVEVSLVSGDGGGKADW